MKLAPELSQMTFAPFGSAKEYDVDDSVERQLFTFFEKIGLSSYGQTEHANANHPRDAQDPIASVATSIFRVRPYDWNGDDDPRAAINFEYAGTAGKGPFQLRWYKYLGRSMSANRLLQGREMEAILAACFQSLGADFSAGCQTYPFKGRVDALSYGSSATIDQYAILKITGENHPISYVCFEEKVYGAFTLGDEIAFNYREPKKKTGSKIFKAVLTCGEALTTHNYEPRIKT